ncbi:MAG: heavy metal translocating P-type ATPase [Pseudomonadota bacterium]
MVQTVTLPIQNMHCGGCAARVQKALGTVAGASGVSVNLAAETAQMTVEGENTLITAMQTLDAAGYPARSDEVLLGLTGLHAAACVARVERAVTDRGGVLDARVNLADGRARVTYLPGLIDAEALVETVSNIGYSAQVLSGEETDNPKRDGLHVRTSFLLAAALTLPVFVLEMGSHMIPAFHHWVMGSIGMGTSWLAQAFLTTLVLFGPGRGFFLKGFPALLRGAPTMDSLVALGAGTAWAFSIVVVFFPELLPRGTQVVYFEAAAVIVTLILMGRWFEARAKRQTGAAIRELIGLQPKTALVRDGERWKEQPAKDLRKGQEFLLRPGARVPADARVLSGEGWVDESMLTGEPMAVAKSKDSALTGGSVNGASALVCVVERTGADTTLAQIIRMVEQAQGTRLPIQALVDQVTLWFVPAVMAIAALTVAIWLIVGPGFAQALVVGVSVLIIACPCAMGLATPTSIMVGTGRAAKLGVLFRQGDALQSLRRVKTIAFDKTGTLTEGRPTLTTLLSMPGVDEDRLLADVACAEQMSEHPIARALIEAANDTAMSAQDLSDFEVHRGEGISARVAGKALLIGNAALMTRHAIDVRVFDAESNKLQSQGQTVMFVAQDGYLAAMLAVSDPIRPSSAAAMTALRNRGLRLAMITGDTAPTAQAVADQLGIETVVAGVMPDQKQAALKQLRADYGPVAFVGDGINDAPVLAEADVGIAVGTGTDVAIESAEVVLLSSDLGSVVDAFTFSAATLRNIKQNLGWAFGYNSLLIPVAAGALYPAFGLLLSPGLAAGAMALSSVFVLANALRLRRMGGV